MSAIRWFLLTLVTPAAAVAADAPARVPETIEFNRDVRPILSDKCFLCHGPDAGTRKGKLRLDVREDALARNAFVPGKPAESEILLRIISKEADEVMPPPEAHKTVDARERAVLERWIAQGAAYQRHWAYEPPVKAVISPGVNGVDFLVARRLAEVGLQPSPEADRRTLIRRLHSDLIGLPPAPADVVAFENDASPTPTCAWWNACCKAPITGNAWRSVGWMWCVTRTRSATTATIRATSGPTGIG